MSIQIQSQVRQIISQPFSLFKSHVISDGRTRRVVKYRRGVEVWEYVSGIRRLPGPCFIQPGMTLDPDYISIASLAFTHTATLPNDPSASKAVAVVFPHAEPMLTADITGIELTRQDAAALEAKAAWERAQLLATRTTRAVSSQEIPSQVITKPTEERVDAAVISNRESRER